MQQFGWVMLLLYFLGGAVTHGYFFETAFLWSHALLWAGVALFCVMVKEMRLTGLHLGMAVFVGAYGVVLGFAVDLENALWSFARVGGLLPLSLLASQLSLPSLVKVMKSWPWLAAGIVMFGLGQGLERDGRLESVFGYANVTLTGWRNAT